MVLMLLLGGMLGITACASAEVPAEVVEQAVSEVEETTAVSPVPEEATEATGAIEEAEATEEISETEAEPVEVVEEMAATTTEYPWWNDRTFYEIFLRSFYDSDGDGIGDINGLIEKLDYLNDGDPTTTDDLGINGIWLMPVMPSPSYHGYDVTDYYDINPEYGTLDDFRRLMEEAHQRDIVIIIDLVLNHTSSQHPWFQEAVANPDSPYRDYYRWAEEHPGYSGPSGPAWHESETGYYYGVFWSEMPDLNLENTAVTRELEEITRFWLEDVGVDGFRLDAIKFLKEDGTTLENTPATHEWLENYYDFYKSINPDAFTVGEVWSASRNVVSYVGDEVDIAFDFELARAKLDSAVSGRNDPIAPTQERILEIYPSWQFATFLANHDQNRTRSVLLSDEKAKSAASLQLLFGGVPFIYYGEEIGQQGTKPDENIRLPMQWTETGGFSVDDTAVLWRDYFRDYETRNVAAQLDDPNSILSHYRRLIHLRNAEPALRTGSWQLVATDQSNIYAAVRQTEDDTLLLLINLGREDIDTYALTLDNLGLTGGTAVEILAGNTAVGAPTLTANGGFENYTPLPLPAYSTFVIRLD